MDDSKASIGSLASLATLVTKKKQRKPTTVARMGQKLSEHYGGPEGWAKQLIDAYDNADNDTAKAQLANRISNAMDVLDQWEREEPDVVPSEIEDDQLLAAVQYLMANPNALGEQESRPFGT